MFNLNSSFSLRLKPILFFLPGPLSFPFSLTHLGYSAHLLSFFFPCLCRMLASMPIRLHHTSAPPTSCCCLYCTPSMPTTREHLLSCHFPLPCVTIKLPKTAVVAPVAPVPAWLPPSPIKGEHRDPLPSLHSPSNSHHLWSSTVAT